MFPKTIQLSLSSSEEDLRKFLPVWEGIVTVECHEHDVWLGDFVTSLNSQKIDPVQKFQLAAVWCTNMVSGSYCFPRYVAALASRAEHDYVRHGLLENAWDESGGYHHSSRSHFWLAVSLVKMLGLTQKQIESVVPLLEAQEYTRSHFEACNSGPFSKGLGMVCLIEEFTTPEFNNVFRALLDTCETGWGITPEKFMLGGGAEYFTANISDDERHRQEMPRLVLAYLKGSGIDLKDEDELIEALEGVRTGMKESISLRQRFYDGIFKYVENGGTFFDLAGG